MQMYTDVIKRFGLFLVHMITPEKSGEDDADDQVAKVAGSR